MTSLERAQQLEQPLTRLAGRLGRNGAASAPDPPGELCMVRRERRRNPRHLAQRHPALEGLLQVTSAQRGLAGMDPFENERLREVAAVRDHEQARPQFVVLALEVLRVVPQLVRIQQLAVDEHRRMEERRAEERVPA